MRFRAARNWTRRGKVAFRSNEASGYFCLCSTPLKVSEEKTESTRKFRKEPEKISGATSPAATFVFVSTSLKQPEKPEKVGQRKGGQRQHF